MNVGMERSNGNRSYRAGSAHFAGYHERNGQCLKTSTSDCHYATAASGMQGTCSGPTVPSPRKCATELQRLSLGATVSLLPQGAKSPRSVPFAEVPPQLNATLVRGPISGVDGTCFVRSKNTDPGSNVPTVKRMECLLMSPTRRTGKKVHMRHWDYGSDAVATVANDQGTRKSLDELFFMPKAAIPCASPDALDAAVAAVGALRIGTPVAVTCGQLMDACSVSPLAYGTPDLGTSCFNASP
ncbi:hypothetical protein VaNZ11_012146 [Volvox africanus]|uniref:Uncharacterized protein n=1 Tax=Volvox africanus TaxID=51714 RepID=A0ABQ5SD80_9CHLO|nr:hypothetical protein VaNZ11_012146 [Volvox africanus]